MSLKIVVLDGFTLNPGDIYWNGFSQLGEIIVYDRTGADQILERAKTAQVLLTNKTPLDRRTLQQLSGLKYIGVLATGFNVVDTGVARELGIDVTNTPDYGTNSVAQMTMALLMELCLHVKDHNDAVLAGKWPASGDFCFWEHSLVELAGKKMGIIGLGNIGRKVADISSALGMEILAYSKSRTDQSYRKNFRWVELSELFEHSDVVSIHCPLTPDTEGLINKETLSRMKKSAFLLNTSRGQIIVEKDLASALNTGVIAGAGLDVLSKEPPSPDNPLLKAKNCIITPHIAWATKEARTRLMDIAVENLRAYLSGYPQNVVN
jgi:glycerate dehydrogenase